MELYTPYVHLARRRNLGDPDKFFLHVVTYCPLINYRFDGYYPLPDKTDEDGVFNIGLKIKQDKDLPNCPGLNPIVHTLGWIQLPFKKGVIKVNVFIDELAQSKSIDSTKATSTVSTTDADEDSRPIIKDF